MITVQKNIPLPIHEWRSYKAALDRAARVTLASVPSQPEGDLTIVLTKDAQIRDLNRQFRGIDSPTDVLSFNLDETNPNRGRKYLGDVVISLERAKEQSTTAGHPLSAELILLTVHGILHLCGYDHEESSDRDRMWEIQNTILASLGLQIELP